ncbi:MULTISPECIES: DUF6252 family protein [unclassified Algibacter]|uniref:DUF6252 family protein n=1 Tax=unclassified Algibacter TaxID=2615009 RepID=UPI00131E8E4F|nr:MULTISPECIES: DUF6252 family protein [unclassified Algibacter]MCL5128368.1 DUF6252 family protein [Algibacter sp. L4_22]
MNYSKKNYELKKINRDNESKTLKILFSKTVVILILLTASLTSCSSDDDSNADQSDYYLTAKVDGVNFSTDYVTISAFQDNTDIYFIRGVGEESSFGFSLESPVSTGTFSATISEDYVLFYQVINPYAVWAATEDGGSGTITITENTNSYVKGTFSFTGFNPADDSTKVITEGKFKAQKL